MSSAQTILIIDDSVLALDLAAEVLQEAGYVVRTASDLQSLAQEQPQTASLILMDVQMPEVFGDDLASVLRDVHHVEGQIVLYSSLAPQDLSARVQRASLDGFICKSDGVDALVSRVKELLEAVK